MDLGTNNDKPELTKFEIKWVSVQKKINLLYHIEAIVDTIGSLDWTQSQTTSKPRACLNMEGCVSTQIVFFYVWCWLFWLIWYRSDLSDGSVFCTPGLFAGIWTRWAFLGYSGRSTVRLATFWSVGFKSVSRFLSISSIPVLVTGGVGKSGTTLIFYGSPHRCVCLVNNKGEGQGYQKIYIYCLINQN